MKKKGQISALSTSILSIVMAVIILVVGIVIIQGINDTIPNDEISTTDTFLSNSGTVNTLAQTPSTFTSATVKNQTWLEFDGVDDAINIPISKTINITDENFTILVFINKFQFLQSPTVL